MSGDGGGFQSKRARLALLGTRGRAYLPCLSQRFSRDAKTRKSSVKIGPWAAFGPSPLSGAFYGAPGVPGRSPSALRRSLGPVAVIWDVCGKFSEIASWLSLCYLSPSPAAPLCAAPPDARSRSSPSSRPLFYLFERLDTATRAARENTDD